VCVLIFFTNEEMLAENRFGEVLCWPESSSKEGRKEGCFRSLLHLAFKLGILSFPRELVNPEVKGEKKQDVYAVSEGHGAYIYHNTMYTLNKTIYFCKRGKSYLVLLKIFSALVCT